MAVTPARHIRIGDELWSAVTRRAAAESVTPTDVVIAALGAWLGSPTVPAVTAPADARPVPRIAPAARPRCPHAETRVIGGWCQQCQVVVQSGGYLPD